MKTRYYDIARIMRVAFLARPLTKTVPITARDAYMRFLEQVSVVDRDGFTDYSGFARSMLAAAAMYQYKSHTTNYLGALLYENVIKQSVNGIPEAVASLIQMQPQELISLQQKYDELAHVWLDWVERLSVAEAE